MVEVEGGDEEECWGDGVEVVVMVMWKRVNKRRRVVVGVRGYEEE